MKAFAFVALLAPPSPALVEEDQILGSRRTEVSMSTGDHLTGVQCPYCKVYLFRAQHPVSGEIVFCAECLAGGWYKEVVEQRGNLFRAFITRESVDNFLRQIRPGGE
jgi:hypothetical protein